MESPTVRRAKCHFIRGTVGLPATHTAKKVGEWRCAKEGKRTLDTVQSLERVIVRKVCRREQMMADRAMEMYLQGEECQLVYVAPFATF